MTKIIAIDFNGEWYRITYLDENNEKIMSSNGLNEEQVLRELNNNLGGLE